MSRYPIPGRLVDVAGHRLHVLDEGSGPAVLLMAALGSNWFDLDPLATRLVVRGWRVIRYDRPGYGLSTAPRRPEVPTLDAEMARMAAVLDVLEVTDPVVLVGHSMASLYVEGFARTYPDRTAGLVVLDGSFVLVPWRVLPPGFRVANAHRLIRAVRLISDRVGLRGRDRSRWRVRILPTPPEGFDAAQRLWGDRVFGGGRMMLATLVENAAFPTINGSLRAVRQVRELPNVPIVVVAALSGSGLWRRFWRAKQARYADTIGGRLCTVGAHHFLVLETPDQVADIIDDVRRG